MFFLHLQQSLESVESDATFCLSFLCLLAYVVLCAFLFSFWPKVYYKTVSVTSGQNMARPALVVLPDPAIVSFLVQKLGITQTIGQERSDVLRRLPTSVAEGGGELSPRLGALVFLRFCCLIIGISQRSGATLNSPIFTSSFP